MERLTASVLQKMRIAAMVLLVLVQQSAVAGFLQAALLQLRAYARRHRRCVSWSMEHHRTTTTAE